MTSFMFGIFGIIIGYTIEKSVLMMIIGVYNSAIHKRSEIPHINNLLPDVLVEI